MGELNYRREGNIDIVNLTGIIEEKDLIQLAKTISTLRQQGSTNILWLGKGIEKIATRDLDSPMNPMRIFRSMGGKIAVAEFEEKHLKIIERTSWKKYLNIFRTENEAKTFLDPQHGN